MAPHHRSPASAPRAGDIVDSAAKALQVFALQRSRPLCDETLVMLLDADGRGMQLITVTGTTGRTDVLTIVDCFAAALEATGIEGGLVVGSVRPRSPFDDDEIATWFDACAIAADHRVALCDWLVISRGPAISVATVSGSTPVWPSGAR